MNSSNYDMQFTFMEPMYTLLLLLLLRDSTLLLCYVNIEKKIRSQFKVFLMYFFVLISNLESKLENLCHVFFKYLHSKAQCAVSEKEKEEDSIHWFHECELHVIIR